MNYWGSENDNPPDYRKYKHDAIQKWTVRVEGIVANINQSSLKAPDKLKLKKKLIEILSK